MTIKNFIPFTGIFTYPIGVLLFRMILMAFESAFVLPRPAQLFVVYGLPIIFPVIITLTNIERKQRGQTDFSFSEVYGLSNKDEKHSKAYFDAAYPDVPEKFASKIPTGLVIGKHKGKYVYVPNISGSAYNAIIVGSPGSGKSVLLLSIIYSMMFADEISKKAKVTAKRKYNYYMVDIKGELYEKILGIKGKDYDAKKYTDLQVVQPSNRNSYGWDIYYRIRKEGVTETEIIKTVSDIADALIMESNGDNAYFIDNAKKILSGVLYYYIKHGVEFLESIQILMRSPLDKLLADIVEDARGKMMGVVIDKLAGFVGKEGNNSVGDIETTLKTYLEVFSYPDIAYCLNDNPNKTSPAALDDGKTNLDIAIEESMLGVYQPLFRLVSMQILRHCESNFHEDDDRYTILYLDEAARIGKINGLDSAFATLRSKHTAIALFFQSISQFKDIYPEQKANTLLNLCEAKIFLSGSGDRDTTEYVKAMAGDYDAVKMSYKHKGFFGGKSDGTYSPEKRPIVDAKTMMQLREKNEAIAFIYGRYVRCKKIKYYQDPYIAPILERRNDEIKNKKMERR